MGDVVGKPGVLAIRTLLPRLIARHEVDLVIANAENSEGGAGISGESAEALLGAEVNLLTSGNHFWTKRQILPWVEAHPELLLRPGELSRGQPRAWATPSSGLRTGGSWACSTSRVGCS